MASNLNPIKKHTNQLDRNHVYMTLLKQTFERGVFAKQLELLSCEYDLTCSSHIINL